MSNVAALWALQTTDLALDAIKQRLAELEKQLADSAELQAAQAAAAEANAELERHRAAQRELDRQIKDLATHIAAARRELMSGRVRNPRELEGMEANVAALDRRRSTLEDEALAVMFELETCQAKVETLNSQTASLAAEHLARQSAIKREAAQKIAEFKTLSARLNQQWAAIAPADRELYKNLRSRKGGRALAREHGGACQACGLMLSTGATQAVHIGRDNIFCPGCGRLLMAG
jgi:uncharacterized protein